MTKSILAIPSWYPPNGGEFFRLYSQSIQAQNFNVKVLANHVIGLRNLALSNLSKYTTFELQQHNKLQEYHFNYFRIPKSEKLNIRLWAESTLKAFEIYLKYNEKPSLLHVHSCLWGGYAASLICQKYGIPYIITEHRSRFVSHNPDADKLIKPFYISFLKPALKHAEQVITVSNNMQKKLINIEPDVENKVFTLPNMVDTDLFIPGKENYPQKPFTFFSLGALEYVKGIDLLLEAFARLPLSILNSAHLTIGGTGNDKTKLYKLAQKLNIENKITWTGQLTQKQVIHYMQQSQAFILPSRFEAFGIVFIEAMACGIPVIGSNAGGPSEFIPADCGLITQKGNVDDIKEKMAYLYKNYQNYNSQKIRETAVNKFSKEAVSLQYANLINKLINHKTT